MIGSLPFSKNVRGRLNRSTWQLLAACGLVAAILAALLPLTRPESGDSAVYQKAATRLLAGEEVYRPLETKPFTYPPLCTLSFIPLQPLPEYGRRAIWYFLNLLVLMRIVAVVLRLVREVTPPEGAGQRRAFFVVTGLLSTRLLISPVEYQGFDLLVMLLAVSAIEAVVEGHWRKAGLWVGIAAALKATPLLFLPLIMLKRRGAAAGIMVGAGLVATLLPDLLFPRTDGQLWVLAWHGTFVSKVAVGGAADVGEAWFSWNLLNQSLAGTLHRLFSIAPPDMPNVAVATLHPQQLRMLTFMAQAGVLLWLGTLVNRRNLPSLTPEDHRFRRVCEGAAILCGMLLLSPMSSKSHFCSLLLPIALCASEFVRHRRDWFTLSVLSLMFFLVTLGAKDLIGRSASDHLLAYGSLTGATLLALTGLTRVWLLREDRLFQTESQYYLPAPPAPTTPTKHAPHHAA